MFEIHELTRAVAGRLTPGAKSALLTGISIDTRTIRPGQAFVAIQGNNFDGHCFLSDAFKKGAACLIVKKAPDRLPRGMRRANFIEVKDTIKALGDIARFRREKFEGPVIAVTGSCGKTTTKDMIAWVLSGSFSVLKNQGTKNNHIGLPLTLCALADSDAAAVLELGSNHPGEIEHLAGICCPDIAVITNIGQSHLAGFGGLAGVFKEKTALLDYLQGARIAILNADSALLHKKFLPAGGKKAFFGYGIKQRCDFRVSGLGLAAGAIEFLVNEKHKFRLKTPGLFNAYNAAAAVAAGRLLGISYNDIAGRLATFVFPQGRLNILDSGRAVFIDDTYNSNPFSLKAALEALGGIRVKGRKILVMGDMLELGKGQEEFHRRAGQQVAQVCDIFIGVGKLSKETAEAARKAGFSSGNTFSCDSPAQARDILFTRVGASPGDAVLVKGSRSMKMEEVLPQEGTRDAL